MEPGLISEAKLGKTPMQAQQNALMAAAGQAEGVLLPEEADRILAPEAWLTSFAQEKCVEGRDMSSGDYSGVARYCQKRAPTKRSGLKTLTNADKP